MSDKTAVKEAVRVLLQDEGLRARVENEITRQVSAKLGDLLTPSRLEELIEKIIARRLGPTNDTLLTLVRNAIDVQIVTRVREALRGLKIDLSIGGKK